MRILGLGVTAALAFATAALAKAPEGPSTIFEAKDLFFLQQAKDPQIRPDGAQIAYVRASEDIMVDGAKRSIWLVDAASGIQTPLVSGAGPAYSPRWSPDGQRLAYIAAPEGKPELFVRWMATGATAQIADLPQAPTGLAWSPDGRSLAFTMMTPDDGAVLGSALAKPEGAKWADPLTVIETVTYRSDGEGYLKAGFDHLYVVQADGGAPRQLTFGTFNENDDVAWSADGRAIFVSANRNKNWEREPSESDVFAVAVTDGALRQLTHRFGMNRQPEASPKGDLIAYLSFEDRRRGYENAELWVMEPDGSKARSLTATLDRSIETAHWMKDGHGLIIQYADHGVSKLADVTLDGKIRVIVSGMSGGELDRPYTGGQFTVGRSGAVAFTQGAPDEPGDVAITRAGTVRTLTHLNDGLFFGKSLGKVTPFVVGSSFDQKPIDAWMITPPGFDKGRKYPLILEIHGGPFASYGPVFASELQLYASAGYVVVYANPRGSTSYGFDFADQINDNYPSHDYDDLMSVVDAALAKGFVDPDSLFVTGGSGGGLLTAWIVGKTGRFRAAVAQKPVINWTSEVLTVDFYEEQVQDWFAKPPWEDPTAYWSRSPLSLVGKVTTPTMLMVGTDDRRTPSSEAEQMYQALQIRGVPTALVRVPGASHGGLAERPSQEAAEVSAILAWFSRYHASIPASSRVTARPGDL